MAEQAAAEPALADRQPYKAAVETGYHWLGAALLEHYHGDDSDMGLLGAAVSKAFAGMTVDAFAAEVREWITTATHPTLHRPYLSCGFVPMIELLRYLEANGFTAYIASGGDRDSMRPFAEGLYGIPPERIIGSALGLDFDTASDITGPLYKSEIEFFDDGPTKPVRIWSRLGRRPLVAAGNSNGDVEMLRFARTDQRDGLRIIVRHDDAERETVYDQGAEDALAGAGDRGWTVVSMRNDWTRVFPED
jgi:hypothetical protein